MVASGYNFSFIWSQNIESSTVKIWFINLSRIRPSPSSQTFNKIRSQQKIQFHICFQSFSENVQKSLLFRMPKWIIKTTILKAIKFTFIDCISILMKHFDLSESKKRYMRFNNWFHSFCHHFDYVKSKVCKFVLKNSKIN